MAIGVFVLGAAGGGYVWWQSRDTGTPTEASAAARADGAPAAEATEAAEPAADKGEAVTVDVGRIAVSVSGGPGGRSLSLLVAPMILAYPGAEAGGEGHGASDPGASDAVKAQLRDSFVEYLSQLSATELRGSAGLAAIREELLRRTRAVAPDLHADAILIQDFLLQ